MARVARLKASSSGILSERENDELLILQKSRHASRKCVLMGKENPGNMAVLSQGPNQLSSKEMASIDDSNDEVQFWKSKYEGMMSVLIETEKDMEEQAKLHQQRQATLENYCNLLQQKADNAQQLANSWPDARRHNMLRHPQLQEQYIAAATRVHSCCQRSLVNRLALAPLALSVEPANDDDQRDDAVGDRRIGRRQEVVAVNASVFVQRSSC